MERMTQELYTEKREAVMERIQELLEEPMRREVLQLVSEIAPGKMMGTRDRPLKRGSKVDWLWDELAKVGRVTVLDVLDQTGWAPGLAIKYLQGRASLMLSKGLIDRCPLFRRVNTKHDYDASYIERVDVE